MHEPNWPNRKMWESSDDKKLLPHSSWRDRGKEQWFYNQQLESLCRGWVGVSQPGGKWDPGGNTIIDLVKGQGIQTLIPVFHSPLNTLHQLIPSGRDDRDKVQ